MFGRAVAAALLGTLLAGCGGPPEPASSPIPAARTGPERLLVFTRAGVMDVDTASGAIGKPVATRGATAIVYPNRDRSRLYLVTGRRETVEVFDVKQGKVVDTLSLSDPEGYPKVRALVFGIAVDPEEKTLYAYVMPTERGMESLRMLEPYVAAVDLKTGQKLRSVPAPPGISAMVFLLDGKTIYLYGRDIYSLDTASFAFRTEVPVRNPGVQGEGVTDIVAEWPHFQENGRWFSVPYSTQDPPTGRWFTGIMTTDLQTGEVEKYEAGPPVDGFVPFTALVAPDGKRAWSIFGSLLEMDLAERRATKMIPLPRSYSIMTITGDGSRIYCAGSGASVLEYDTARSKVVREVVLPSETSELMLVPR